MMSTIKTICRLPDTYQTLTLKELFKCLNIRCYENITQKFKFSYIDNNLLTPDNRLLYKLKLQKQ